MPAVKARQSASTRHVRQVGLAGTGRCRTVSAFTTSIVMPSKTSATTTAAPVPRAAIRILSGGHRWPEHGEVCWPRPD